MPLVPFLVLAAGLAVAQAPSAPQDARPSVIDERVVVTATAAPASAMALGRAVTIVTRDDIERFAGGSIADALRLVPGVDVRARGDKGVQADFVIRGASFGQALVLVDGMRLNDAQSGHHNADFPVSAASIDRIEVVTGGASSAHGADAFGGVINIVTRGGRYGEVSAAAGSFASARAEATAGWTPLALSASTWGSRSDGFMFDRDHAMGGARVSLSPIAGARVSAAHVSKAFGANGFYGPSPSKEWTDQTMVAASAGHAASVWTFDGRVAVRQHGDRFRWDIARPGFAENTHETRAVEATGRVDRTWATSARLTLGASGGADWIDSSNLGERTESRAGAFAEVQFPVASRLVLQPAVRIDRYATFGSALSPSLAASWWGQRGWRARASAGRAFRVPTYTERYYTDPNHSARQALDPEHGWTADAGVDWRSGAWSASATAFGRWDADVIDWVRASTAERWQTTNVHEVTTYGVELQGMRAIRDGFLRLTYARVESEAPALSLLSKYVLDYTRHALGAQAVFTLPARLETAIRADWRDRSDSQRYALLDARVSRRVGPVRLFVEGANLLAERYTEIAGVAMPGRSAMAGAAFRR